jgi:hypothetical protein
MARNKTPFPHAPFSFGLDRPTTGRVFYVNSAAANASDGNLGDSPDRPLATLDGFFNHPDLTANNGDTCYVMPNHAETVTGVGGITADVAGVRVVGLGRGAQRPRFLMDGATTVTFVVSAADVELENLVFAGGHNTIATCFNVDALNFSALNLEFEDNAADEHFIFCFDVGSATDDTCDGLTIVGCRYVTVDTGVTHFINLTGNTTGAVITDNFYCADAATGAQLLVQAAADSLFGLQFLRNTLITGATAVDLLIENDQSDNTGIAAYNLAGHHDTAAAVLVDCDGIRQFENYSTASDTASGVLDPDADTDT